MDNTGITPVMPIGGANSGFGFGDSGLWLFAILALFGLGGNGLFGNNNLGYRPATAEDVNNGFNFADLQNQNRDIINVINGGTAQAIAATERIGGEIISDIHDVALGVADTKAHQQECCCNILRSIDGVNYASALNTASINANTTAQVQKVLDAISANKVEALQSRVNQLELQQAVAGVVRYPTTSAYTSGCNPFCGCGCNGNI